MTNPWLPRTETEVIEGFAAACERYEGDRGTGVVVRRWGEKVDILRSGKRLQRVDARFQRNSEEKGPRFPNGKLPRFTVRLWGDRWMHLDFHRASGKGWRFEWGREGRLAGGTPPTALIAVAERTLDTMPAERSLDDKATLDSIWLPLLLRGPRET